MLVVTCPSREELLDYAVGKLSDEASDALASHFDACPELPGRIGRAARCRTIRWSPGSAARVPSDPFLDEPECGRSRCSGVASRGKRDASATNLPRQLGEYQLLARTRQRRDGHGLQGPAHQARPRRRPEGA